MSQVTIVFFRGGGRLGDLGDAPLCLLSDPQLVAEVITSSGTSQVTTATSPHPDYEGLCRIINNGNDVVSVVAGAAPVAVSAKMKVLANSREDFAVRFGDKVAVINS